MARSAGDLRVKKMRGIKFRGGYHDFIIETGGIKMFPGWWLPSITRRFVGDLTKSGVDELDALLGGGLERRTSALLVGGAGVGKSSIAVTYAVGAADAESAWPCLPSTKGSGRCSLAPPAWALTCRIMSNRA